MAIFKNQVNGHEIDLYTQEGDFFVDASGDRWDRVIVQSALSEQIGGSHYKNLAIQPVEFIHKNGLNYIVGNIIKYCCRYQEKSGIEDLKKARHYLDILIEMEEKK